MRDAVIALRMVGAVALGDATDRVRLTRGASV